MRLERHRIVHLHPACWPAILAGHPGLAAIPALAGWVEAGRPLIARRPQRGDAPGLVPLGLPLPPAAGKGRLACAVPPAAVASTAPPPLLAEAAGVAPAAWGSTVAALVALDPATRCFGSLAWAHLTGLPYLAASSDLDLLWRAPPADGMATLLAAIARVDATAPMRLDGEIVTPGGLAIQWREWASEAPELLAKAWDRNLMVPRGAVP